VEEGKILCLYLESNPDSLVIQPVAWSIYSLSYLDKNLKDKRSINTINGNILEDVLPFWIL
jgi:hypothetical protein